MTPTITAQSDGTTAITLDFADESVALSASTSVIGDAAKAERYVETFETDIRRHYSHLFPLPPAPETSEEKI
jgi:hypothetical protein